MTSIETKIRQAENKALSDDELRMITEGKCNIITYEQLHSVNHIDEILQPFGAVIILYQLESDTGHWCSLKTMGKNKLDFFGSYGLKIDEQLKFSNYNLRLHKGEVVPHLTHLINNSKYKVSSNMVQLQENIAHVSTCGRYAGLFIRFRNLSNKEFVDLFTKNREFKPDFWVSAITYLF
jgi:hypothetical protein